MGRKKEIVQILRDVQGVVSYQQSCTITEYPGTDSLDRFLASQWPQVITPKEVVQPVSGKPQQVRTPAIPPSAKVSDQKTIVETEYVIFIGTDFNFK